MSAPFRSLIGFGVVILSAIPFLNAEFTYRTAKQADVLRTDSGMRLASLFPVEDTNLFSELRMVAINIFQEERGSRCRKRPETLLSRLKDLINPPIVSAAECQAGPCGGHYYAPYTVPCGDDCGGGYATKFFGGVDPDDYYRGSRYDGNGVCPASDSSGMCICKEVSCFSF